jgi:gliding motility-associated lipoprotein GldD
MRINLFSSVSLLFLLVLFSCGGDKQYTPKPRGYLRVTFPEHKYKQFDPPGCPFKFEIPELSVSIPDTNSTSEPCWYYLVFPELNGQLYLTYKTIHGDLREVLENTRTLVYTHTTRASSIDERTISFNNGVYGIIYDIGGEAASPTQFFVTDSSNHFLRGALYFNAEPNADSIAPTVAYMKKDIEHLLSTLKWK